jgi:hydroxymethylpyrimidine/phosphomethylpyrimidine kinase
VDPRTAIPPQVLTVAGSDSGGGAGLQADLKAIHANGAYALVAVTAVTAQHTRGVLAVEPLPAEVITAQIDAVFGDFSVGAVKTGMLGSRAAAEAVAAALARHGAPQLVVDPVMASTSGTPLIEPDALEVLRAGLLPLARVCTPNRREAEVLAGRRIATLDDAREAALRIRDLGPRAVLLKGGHLGDREAIDLLVEGEEIRTFAAPRVPGPAIHGTGCTLAAALATRLARGESLPVAVEGAKRFVTEAIRHATPVGRGHPAADPFFFLAGRDWTAFAAGERPRSGGGKGA